MICPNCKSENEMALSALIHGFVCPDPLCGVEVEMEPADIAILIDSPIGDPVYA